MPTPWRKLSYEQLSSLELSGRVLDLGGSRKSKYHELIKGEHSFDVVNIDDTTGRDLSFNLENKFPLKDEKYDAVLAVNVLEHIFDYENVFSESYRVLKNDGTLIIAVPFLMFYHPSPHDYWRYTKETLEKLLHEAGYKDVVVTSVGKGPFTAMVQFFGGLRAPELMRTLLYYTALFLDKLLTVFLKSNVLVVRYPLGYFVIAKK